MTSEDARMWQQALEYRRTARSQLADVHSMADELDEVEQATDRAEAHAFERWLAR